MLCTTAEIADVLSLEWKAEREVESDQKTLFAIQLAANPVDDLRSRPTRGQWGHQTGSGSARIAFCDCDAAVMACCSRPIDGDEGIEVHRVTYSLRDCLTLAP